MLSVCAAQVPVNPKMRSFSSAVKGGHLAADQELVLYESNTGEPGVITEQWFTGKWYNLRIDVSTHKYDTIKIILVIVHGSYSQSVAGKRYFTKIIVLRSLLSRHFPC